MSSYKTVYTVPETYAITPAPLAFSDYAQHRSDSLIIDNGATHLRAGWSTDSSPRLVTENIGSRYKDRKIGETYLLAGTEAYVDASSRSGVKSAFEGDIICNFDQMEHMLDYVFHKLGVQGDSVRHPVVMTEALCNAHYSRKGKKQSQRLSGFEPADHLIGLQKCLSSCSRRTVCPQWRTESTRCSPSQPTTNQHLPPHPSQPMVWSSHHQPRRLTSFQS